MKRSFLALFCALLPHAPAVTAQTPQPAAIPEEAYIDQALGAAKQPLPHLGWILPNGTLVTDVSAPAVLVLSDKPAITSAQQSATIPANRIRQFVNAQHVACDAIDAQKPSPLYRYKTGLPARKEPLQVFVLNASQTGVQASGPVRYKSTPAEDAPVWKAMSAKPADKRLSRSFAVPGGQVFYTVAATYNLQGLLIRSGVFLQDHTGKILGKTIDKSDPDTQCDGCAIPSTKDGINAVYFVENLVQIPGLAYPALMADSSTVETRAIELFTFSPKGEPSRYRLDESMVNCIPGSAE